MLLLKNSSNFKNISRCSKLFGFNNEVSYKLQASVFEFIICENIFYTDRKRFVIFLLYDNSIEDYFKIETVGYFTSPLYLWKTKTTSRYFKKESIEKSFDHCYICTCFVHSVVRLLYQNVFKNQFEFRDSVLKRLIGNFIPDCYFF